MNGALVEDAGERGAQLQAWRLAGIAALLTNGSLVLYFLAIFRGLAFGSATRWVLLASALPASLIAVLAIGCSLGSAQPARRVRACLVPLVSSLVMVGLNIVFMLTFLRRG